MIAGLSLVALVLGLLAIRQNVVVILLAAAAYVHLVWGDGQLIFLIEDLWLSLDNEVLLAIPMFLLAGAVMTRGSIAARLIDLAVSVTKPIPGGLAVATILSCAIFAAISGSSPVTLLAVGTILYPALIENGYPKRFALGALTSGGTLGIIIPPSIPLILYGIVTETSIAELFLAGLIPGLLIATVLAGYSFWVNRHMPAERFDPAGFALALRRGGWSMLLPAILLGGIYSGAFTPTEGAAVGFAAALVITAFWLRTLTWRALWEAIRESALTTVAILLIIAGAKIFGKAIALYRIPQDVSAFIAQTFDGPLGFILAVSIVLILMGLVFEALSMVLIMTPVLLPSAMGLGFDPIWFGIYMVIMVEVALITPPVGLNLYVIQSVAKTSLAQVARGVWPFLLLMLATVAALYVVPDLALYIPFKW